ncbi:MAG: nucleotidyltransferase domain-containing protein [Thermomicrobiales bacterium]
MSNALLTRQIGEVVEAIVDRIAPSRVILFGSHAHGTADPGSDVDLLVVMESSLPPLQQAAAISRALDHRVPVDIVVRTPTRVAARHPRDIMLRTILDHGVVVYETRN